MQRSKMRSLVARPHRGGATPDGTREFGKDGGRRKPLCAGERGGHVIVHHPAARRARRASPGGPAPENLKTVPPVTALPLNLANMRGIDRDASCDRASVGRVQVWVVRPC